MYSIDNNNMKKVYIADMNNSYNRSATGMPVVTLLDLRRLMDSKVNRSHPPNESLHTLYKHSSSLEAPRA